MDSELHQLVEVVADLRKQQAAINEELLTELKRISNGFQDYRTVLHERFDKIHSTGLEVDERLEALEIDHESHFQELREWKDAQTWRLRLLMAGSLAAAFLAAMVDLLLLHLFSH